MSARVISSAVAVNAPMGSRLDPLPATPYSPDLNPIEMAFAKLKAHLRARAINTINALWKAIGDICALLSPAKCMNDFTAVASRLWGTTRVQALCSVCKPPIVLLLVSLAVSASAPGCRGTREVIANKTRISDHQSPFLKG
jgi:hypothetical protein